MDFADKICSNTKIEKHKEGMIGKLELYSKMKGRIK